MLHSAQRQRKQNVSNPFFGSKTGNKKFPRRFGVVATVILASVSAAYIIFGRGGNSSSVDSEHQNAKLRTNGIAERPHEIVVETSKNTDVVEKDETNQSRASMGSEKDLQIVTKKEDEVVDGGTLTLKTEHGPIRIVLRTDLSPESLSYLRDIVASGSCPRCNLYRAENGFLLQGVIGNPEVEPNKILGKCPPEYHDKTEPLKCPEHDPNCGCHGPVMTRGMVGWAGGGGGPDFFIDTDERKAVWWETQHTVWGKVKDDESFAVIDKIYTLPTTKETLTMLNRKIEFTLELVNDGASVTSA